MASSRMLPSLATVCERFRPICGRNLDCLKLDFSFSFSVLVVLVPSELLSLRSLLPSLFILKKFRIRWETWLFEADLLVDKETPLKVRFSFLVVAEWLWVELNNWVMFSQEVEVESVACRNEVLVMRSVVE